MQWAVFYSSRPLLVATCKPNAAAATCSALFLVLSAAAAVDATEVCPVAQVATAHNNHLLLALASGIKWLAQRVVHLRRRAGTCAGPRAVRAQGA